MRAALAAGACAALLLAAPPTAAAGDPERGKKLHDGCMQCHTAELYAPPKAKVRSLKALAQEVRRWGDYYNPALTRQEIDDLVAYLSRDFYGFAP